MPKVDYRDFFLDLEDLRPDAQDYDCYCCEGSGYDDKGAYCSCSSGDSARDIDYLDHLESVRDLAEEEQWACSLCNDSGTRIDTRGRCGCMYGWEHDNSYDFYD